MKNQTDVYEKITASIIEAIEAGCGKFEMPWHTFGSLPSSAANKRCYRGINVLVLWAAASRFGYKTRLWATYQQWRGLGAQVRQREKSTAVVFWKFYGEESETDSDSPEDENTSDSRRRCFARAYHVFNADQDPSRMSAPGFWDETCLGRYAVHGQTTVGRAGGGRIRPTMYQFLF